MREPTITQHEGSEKYRISVIAKQGSTFIGNSAVPNPCTYSYTVKNKTKYKKHLTAGTRPTRVDQSGSAVP